MWWSGNAQLRRRNEGKDTGVKENVQISPPLPCPTHKHLLPWLNNLITSWSAGKSTYCPSFPRGPVKPMDPMSPYIPTSARADAF